MRNKKAIGRFPEFDNQFFTILKTLGIELTDKKYADFLNHGQHAKDIVETASLLNNAGILTMSRYDQILAHQEIQEIKKIFTYLAQIHSLTEYNYNLVMNCKSNFELEYIHTLFILKNKNPKLVTPQIFKELLEHSNSRLILHALNTHSSNLSIVSAICILLTENLLTESVLGRLIVNTNPSAFATDLKTAKFIAETYRDDKKKSGFFSCSSKASTDIVSSLEHFSTTGNNSFFQKLTVAKPGKRLQTILNEGDNASIFTRMKSSL